MEEIIIECPVCGNNHIITIIEFRKYENEFGCDKDYFSSNLAHISSNREDAEKWIENNIDYNNENEVWWRAIYETRIESDLVDEEYIMNLTFYDKNGNKTIGNGIKKERIIYLC